MAMIIQGEIHGGYKRVQVFEDLVPLSQLNLLSLDLYECPVSRLSGYKARVFGIVKYFQYLDKTDVDGKERFESNDKDEENFDEEDDEDELDADEEDEYQDGLTINGPGKQVVIWFLLPLRVLEIVQMMTRLKMRMIVIMLRFKM
eukprot:Gb_15560 [translate_table: standard]